MAEDPKAFFKRMSTDRAVVNQKHMLLARQYANRFLSKAEITGVFCYLGCGSDFAYPLQHFSDRCDTFVFCDWTNGAENLFLDRIKGLKVDRPRRVPDDLPDFLDFPLDQTIVGELANMGHLLTRFFPSMASNLVTYLANPASAKGHYAEFWVKDSNDTSKFVRVFWLAMEGVNLYTKLFTENQTAPRVLCIKNWGHIGGEWTPFGNWQAHLGTIVRTSRKKPEYLVAREEDHDWPWTVRVAEFRDWDDRPVIVWARNQAAVRRQKRSKQRRMRE